MSDAVRATIYFEPELHRALKVKSAFARRSVSDLVNEAVRQTLREDREDLAAFDDRIAEPTVSYETLLEDLEAHGKL